MDAFGVEEAGIGEGVSKGSVLRAHKSGKNRCSAGLTDEGISDDSRSTFSYAVRFLLNPGLRFNDGVAL